MAITGEEVITAIALIMVIEGAIYALFPNQMRNVMATFLSMKIPTLVKTGVGFALLGLVLLMAVRG